MGSNSQGLARDLNTYLSPSSPNNKFLRNPVSILPETSVAPAPQMLFSSKASLKHGSNCICSSNELSLFTSFVPICSNMFP